MTVKKSLENRIRGWFPQEPRMIVRTRLNVDSDKKQPPLMIPPEYTVSATKAAVVFAVFWIILYGFFSFTSINFERYPVSIVQVVAWIIAGLVVGTVTSAIVTKSQLGRLLRDYRFEVNGKDLVILLVPIVLFFVFGVYESLPFIGTRVSVSDIQGLYIGVLAWGISSLIIRAALFAAFEKEKDMRIMQSWWGGAMYLVPKAPQSQLNARGELLSFFLVAGIVGCVVAALGYVAIGLVLLSNSIGGLSGILSRLPIPLWTLTVYPILAIVNVCALAALYRWRKWGFYLLLSATLGAFALNVFVLGFRLEFFLELSGLALIYVLLRPKWNILKPGWPKISIPMLLAILGIILLIASLTPTSHFEDRLKLVPQGETVASNRFTLDHPLADTEIAANLTTNERLYFEIIIAKMLPKPYGNSSVTFTISNQSLSSGNPKQIIFTNDQIGLQGDYYMHWSPLQNGTYYFTLHYNYSGLNQIWYLISKGWNTLEPIQVPVYTPALAMYTAPVVVLGAALLAFSLVVFARKNRTKKEFKVNA